MKFTCTQENLNHALLNAYGITAATAPLPILKNILIEAKNDAIKISATDLEIGLITQLRGKIESEGEITVDAKIVSNFVNLLPQDKVEVSTQGNHLSIKGGVHKTKISGIAAEDFPVIPKVSKKQGHTVLGSEIKKSLLQVMPAVSLDDTRPEITGVYWQVDEKGVTLAGTDSYRLAQKKIPMSEKKGYIGQVIVPLKTAKEFVRTLSDEDESVDIAVSENQILFSYGQTTMVSRLLEGDYPDYRQIIPSSHNVQFVLGKEEFINAVKISGLFASVGSNSVTIEVAPPGKLSISSATSAGEERTDIAVTVEGSSAQAVKIVFDYRYLLDGLMSIDSEEVRFSATSASSPAMITPAEEKAEELLYIVMPIRQ